MELWGWLIGYMVLFASIHVVLYYVYVRRDDGAPTDVGPAGGNGEYAGFYTTPRVDGAQHPGEEANPVEDHDDTDSNVEYDAHSQDLKGETTACPHCGAPNESDRTFTYCRLCISPLRY